MSVDDLLKRLNAGEFDGAMHDKFGNGTLVEYEIKDSIPTRTYHGKTQRFFNGRENEKWNKVEKQVFETDDQKKEFIRRYGYNGNLFNNDQEARRISKEYYDNLNREKPDN